MSRCLVALSSILVLATGCRHANVPTLPASHGHLSLALDEYLKLPTTPVNANSRDELPEVVVEPAQAPVVFAEAVQVLKGTPSEEEVSQARADLEAACKAKLQTACDFLHEEFEAPERREGSFPAYPREALAVRATAMVVVRCRLQVNGRLRACEVLEMAPFGFTKAVLDWLRETRYRPALLAGHPIEITYTLFVKMTPPGGVTFTPEEWLQWFRMRAERFPESTAAWFGLATTLAKQAPEDPAYIPALQHLNKINPDYWWSANEVAWMHAQAKRYAEAAPLAKQARDESPRNPYVLETSAAVLAGLGQCEEAIAEQRRAVTELPPEWPAPELERFRLALENLTHHCPTAAPTPQATPPH